MESNRNQIDFMDNREIYLSDNERSLLHSTGPFFKNMSNGQGSYQFEEKTQFIGNSEEVGEKQELSFDFTNNHEELAF